MERRNWEGTYDGTDSVLLFHLVLQLPETRLHPLVEWPQGLRHLLPMDPDAFSQEWDLESRVWLLHPAQPFPSQGMWQHSQSSAGAHAVTIILVIRAIVTVIITLILLINSNNNRKIKNDNRNYYYDHSDHHHSLHRGTTGSKNQLSTISLFFSSAKFF